MQARQSGTRVITGEVTILYPHLDEPRSGLNGGAAKYGAMIVIPKSNAPLLEAISGAINAAIKESMEKGRGNVTGGRMPLRDADAETDSQGTVRSVAIPALKGCYYINASSKSKPALQVRDNEREYHWALPGEIYGGSICICELNFFAYSQQGARGVSCGLNGVLKVKDGERVGGSTDLATMMGLQATLAPTQPQAPAQTCQQPAPAQTYQQPAPQPQQPNMFGSQPAQQGWANTDNDLPF